MNGYTYCTDSFEYGLAGFVNRLDPNTEGNVFGVRRIQSALPAPENLVAVGAGGLQQLAGEPARYLTLQWAPYKGACRNDFQGFRIYRECDGDSSVCSRLVEITDAPTTAPGYVLGSDDLPHIDAGGGVFKVPLTTRYRVSAFAFDRSGNPSRSSNAVCVQPGAATGTRNPASVFVKDNIECESFIPDDPNSSPTRVSDQTGTITLKPSYPSSSWSVIQIHESSRYSISPTLSQGARRIRVYKSVAGDPNNWQLVTSLPGDEGYFALEGWNPQNDGQGTELPNPVQTCDLSATYAFRWEDTAGNQSALSTPVNPSRTAILSAAVQPDGVGVELNWSTFPVCATEPVSFVVYKADAPDGGAFCAWDPNSPTELQRLTPTPITGQTFYDAGDTSSGEGGGEAGTSSTGPPPPALVRPGLATFPGQPIYTTTPTYEWQPVTGADEYGLKIQKKKSDGTWDVVYNSEVDFGSLQGTSFTMPAGVLLDGKKYRWKVRAHDSSGWGNYSDPFFFVENPGLLTDRLVYYVRVLRVGDDPNLDWPPPPYKACASVLGAEFDSQDGPEALWRVARSGLDHEFGSASGHDPSLWYGPDAAPLIGQIHPSELSSSASPDTPPPASARESDQD